MEATARNYILSSLIVVVDDTFTANRTTLGAFCLSWKDDTSRPTFATGGTSDGRSMSRFLRLVTGGG